MSVYDYAKNLIELGDLLDAIRWRDLGDRQRMREAALRAKRYRSWTPFSHYPLGQLELDLA